MKAAAQRLGVGRPALSNLLNGKASLSSDMALRLERAFGADHDQLLALQGDADRQALEAVRKSTAVRAYVPNFLSIKARHIEAWAATKIEARQHLAVLLRRLIHSTGSDLTHVDFSGFDNAERKGPDGQVEAGAATAWIPQGKSFWEFGVDKDVVRKAKKDHSNRSTSVPVSEQLSSTLMHVTPRNWPAKAELATQLQAEGKWKSVRVLDASDLEQWLEESIPAQMWIAERLEWPVSGFQTLDHCWDRWSAASHPPMTRDAFEPSIAAYRRRFAEWLAKPSERPLVVSADSRDEALAFLACLFREKEIPERAADLAVVFESPETLRQLEGASSPFIPIVFTPETARELATLYRQLHCIVINPRNAVDSEPEIALDLLSDEAFRNALEAMQIGREDAERLAIESGRSPTILRRRLSRIDAIRTPRWAGDPEISRKLIPMALVGAWHAHSSADREVLLTLADRPYSSIEEDVASLLLFDDSPVWSVGQHRGVASKIDALFGVSKAITEKDLTDFLLLAEYVLAEADPALVLPEDQRWAAGIYGKMRDHSPVLRKGVCETLVILAVHGDTLFRARLGVALETRVRALIDRLLTPLTLDKFLSHDRDLPRYAEASPDGILSILEADLKQPEPILVGLLRPVSSAPFAHPSRTGLLWALECLAWKPQNLARVTAILAQLSHIKIEDNWVNKPIGSLSATLRSWMPQTAASCEERIKILEMLAKRFPEIGWQVCVAQFEPGSHIGRDSYRPQWRNDASGAGQPVSDLESYRFIRAAIDLALAWPSHTEKTLGDLVERIQVLHESDAAAIWDLVDKWSSTEVDEGAKATLREHIRRYAFTRRGHRLTPAVRDRAREVYDRLEPKRAVIRHRWLFEKHWVEESADELDAGIPDFKRRDERISQLRLAAIADIWAESGFQGVVDLLASSGAPATVGWIAAGCVPTSFAADFVTSCLALDRSSAPNIDVCLQGFLAALPPDIRSELLNSIGGAVDTERAARLFKNAPFEYPTWRLLDQYPAALRDLYWQTVDPNWGRHGETALIEIVDRLLAARRPRAAFHAAHMDWEHVDSVRLKRLLLAVATDRSEPLDQFTLDPHDISRALKSLDGRAEITRDDMAHLEFLFMDALDDGEHGIPNLERQITQSPGLFVQLIALLYKRSDGGNDPPEWQIEDPERQSALATRAYRLLRRLTLIPGSAADGTIEYDTLVSWIAEVRKLCAQHGRVECGDYCIGELLSHAPAGDDGVRPCLSVAEAMEGAASPSLAKGFSIGIRNSRGAHYRGEGGSQERELAAIYRGWAGKFGFDLPFVAKVLEDIALSYDHQAAYEDSDAQLRRRVGY